MVSSPLITTTAVTDDVSCKATACRTRHVLPTDGRILSSQQPREAGTVVLLMCEGSTEAHGSGEPGLEPQPPGFRAMWFSCLSRHP